MQRNAQMIPSEEPHRERWWLRLTAPPGASQYDLATTHQEREQLRRSQLTSWTAPFVFFAPLLLLQQAQSEGMGTTSAIIVLMATAILALFCNRVGQQVLAALLLVLAMDAVIEGALITAPGGLSTGWLLSFDLFVIPLIAVGVLLGRRFLWAFMVFHIVCILGDFYVLPHAPDLLALMNVWHGPTIAFARPIIIQIGGCLLSFIEVRSTDQAILRADRAQVIVELQQSIKTEKQLIAEEHRQLEAGVQEIVGILAKAANGYFTIRATLPQTHSLWQIASSLNTLFNRLQNSKQTDLVLHQIEQEVHRIREALQNGVAPLPSGGLLDPLIRDLRASAGLDAPLSSQEALGQQSGKKHPHSQPLQPPYFSSGHPW